MPVTTDRIREILGGAEHAGSRVVIHERLDRDEYRAVNTVLTNLGGAWSRRDKAHLFDHNPGVELRRVIEDGWMPKSARTAEGFVRTPRELADRIIRDHLDDAEEMDEQGVPLICEPSAGDGAVVQALLDAYPQAAILAIEPNRERARPIEDMPVGLTRSELEDVAEDHVGTQHAVVMNPPFSTGRNATLWIDHVFLAWRMLRPGGKLLAIAPAGYVFREDRRHRAVRSLIEDNGGGHQELPDGSFAQSGTQVRTVLIWAEKPVEPKPKRKRKGKPSEEEKQQRRDEDVELRTEASERLEDEAYVARMEKRVQDLPEGCRLAQYSARNQALVFMQALEKDIEVTGHLNTFKGWAEQGRVVKAGQSALRITAAMGDEEETTEDADGNEEKRSRPRFRMTTRFDLSQTKPLDVEEGGEQQ